MGRVSKGTQLLRDATDVGVALLAGQGAKSERRRSSQGERPCASGVVRQQGSSMAEEQSSTLATMHIVAYDSPLLSSTRCR